VFLSREVEYVIVALAVVFFGLTLAARRYPHVAWLRPFHPPKLSARQQAIQRRRANTLAGLEMILLGIIVPLGFVAITVMMFNDFDPLVTVLVIGGSIVCIGLGIAAIARSRRE
jgi:hypothetical protein